MNKLLGVVTFAFCFFLYQQSQQPLPGVDLPQTWTATQTFNSGIIANSISDTGLTVGNCVQATTGGQLVTSSGPCGTTSGTLTATGSPVSGNLAKWSGATSLTNGDISGDCTTAGALAITCTKTSGTPFASSATVDATNASNISSGNLSVNRLNSGTGASASTFWRGDGSWAAGVTGLPSVVYNTVSASTNASIGTTAMATAGGSGSTYRFHWYADITATGTSCTGASTLAVSITYTDPNSGSSQNVSTIGLTGTPALVTAFTMGTNPALGTSIPLTNNSSPFIITFRVKASTSVSYFTTFTAGTGCSPAPKYQIYPILEQLQ